MSKAGETVTVACKLPQGLQLRNFVKVDGFEATPGGGSRKCKIAQQVGDTIRINGYGAPNGKSPLATVVEGGFALTYGVPKDFWDEWLKTNKDLDVVKSGLVFAHTSIDHVAGHSKEHEKLKCGLEPLDPDALPKGIEPFKKAA